MQRRPWRRRSARSVVSGEVSSEVTSSTSRSTGTGLKKWMPITCSGRLVAMPSFMIGIEDVLEARMASSPSTTLSSAGEHLGLELPRPPPPPRRPAPGRPGRPRSVVQSMRPRAASRSSSVSLPDRTPRSSAGRHPTLAGLGGAGVDLPDHHVEPGPGAHLGDARAHQAAADHPDPLDHAHADRRYSAAVNATSSRREAAEHEAGVVLEGVGPRSGRMVRSRRASALERPPASPAGTAARRCRSGCPCRRPGAPSGSARSGIEAVRVVAQHRRVPVGGRVHHAPAGRPSAPARRRSRCPR